MRTLNLGVLDRLGTRFSLFFESSFRFLGSRIGARPWLWILGAVVFTVLCSLGFFNFEREFRGEKLWNPSGTEAAEDKDYVDEYYRRPFRFAELIVLDPSNDDIANVLTPQVFDLVHAFQNRTYQLRAENPDFGKPNESQFLVYDNREVDGYQDESRVCFVRGDACFLQTFPDAMGNNPDQWDTQDKILSFVNRDEIVSTSGYPYHPSVLLGGITRDEDGKIIRAKAMSSTFNIQNNEVYDKSKEPDDPRAKEWEGEFLDLAKEFTNEVQSLRILRMSSRSYEDEFDRMLDNDLQLLNIAIILLLVYSITMLSRWSEGWVGIRFLLSIGGFISIGLALVSALGLGSAFGIFYSPLMNIFPFLLIGIGVDDVFVLVNAMDGTSRALTISERLSSALAVSGTSITVTSVTDFFAFLIGSNTSLPALRNFSLYAAIGLILTLIMQVTFFAGITVYDEYRHESNLSGILPCISAKKQPLICCRASDDKFMSRSFEALGQLLTKSWIKAIVIISALVLAGVGIAGTIQMKVDADVDDFYPANSYLKDWMDATTDYFTSSGTFTGIYMREVDFSSEKIHRQMDQMVEAFREDEWVQDYTVRSWFEEFSSTFEEKQNIPINSAFVPAVLEWLEGTGAAYEQDIVFDENRGKIITSRMTGNHVFADKSAKWVDSMDSLRDTVKNQLAPLSENSFAYGRDYVEYEQYKAIGREALINLSLALMMVFVIITLLLVNPVAAGITFIAIALVVVELVGFLYWWGFKIDNVLVIFTVISLGLSVDYAVHISHMFLKIPGDPNERLVAALRDMGPAVFNGAMSTFIAVLVLAMTDSYIFNVFFSSLFLCVILGMAHGVVFLPVCLSILAPAPHAEEMDSTKELQMQPANNNEVSSSMKQTT
eukprot:g9085.t1